MTNKTNAAHGDKTNMVTQAVGLFATLPSLLAQLSLFQ